MAGFDLGDVVAHLKLEMGEFTNALNTAKNEIQNTSSKFDGLTAAGQAVSSVGKTLTASVTAPVMACGAAAVKMTTDFNASMSKVQALSGATGEDLQMLRDIAKEMGATTMYSATEAADALGYMALAGWDAQESAAALPGVLDLAAASGMDLAQASDLCTDYMSAFGMEASEAGRMADVLAYAQANSNTTTEMLGEAFKNCAVNANSFGLDVEQTTALLGKLADQGLKGSEAGTALNAVFRDMSSKMKDGAIAIGDTNVKIVDAQGNFRDMADIVRDVNAATDGMSESEKMVALQSTFTADSIKAMGILCNTGADDIDEFTEALYGSKGAAEEMADAMNDNLAGDIQEMKSAVEAAAIAIGEKLDPVLRNIVQTVTKVVSAFAKLPAPVLQVIMVVAGLAATIGPLLLIIGKVMSSIQKMRETMLMLKAAFTALKSINIVSSLMSGFQTVITTVYVFIMDSLIPALSSLWAFMLANPITFVIAAIVALIAIFVVLWNKCEWFREFWINLWNQCKEAVLGFYNRNKEIFDAVANYFKAQWEAIKNIFGGFITFLKGIFTGDMETAVEGLKQMWEGIKSYFSNLWDAVKNLFSLAWEGIKNVLSQFGEWCWNFCTVTIPNAFMQFVNWLGQLPGKIAYWLAYCIVKVVKWKMDMTQKAIECAKEFVTNVINWLKELPGKVWTWLVNTYNKAVQWGSNMKQKAQEAGTNFVNGVINFLKNLPSQVWNWFTQTINKATQFVTNFKQKATDAGQQFCTNIKNALTNLPSQMATIGSNICQGLVNGIKNGIKWVADAASNLAKSALDGAKAALGIKSPSRVFRDMVGKNIVEGLQIGITANADSAYKTMSEFSQNLIRSVNMPELQSSINMNSGDISANNIIQDNQMASALREMKQMLEDNKQDIDYNKMADAVRKGAQAAESVIYMDKTIVGRKTAPTVSKTNESVKRRLNRLEGNFDE